MDFFALTDRSEGFYKEKGSKFLSFAYPVSGEEEVKIRIEELKKEFHDARHHCYAFRVGLEDPKVRANDDEEPNHSAGDPILGQIRSFNMTNILVVVVRYFGGTKLGVSGLINAYKTAAEDSLLKAKKKRIFPVVQFEIPFEYNETNEVEKFLHDKEVEIIDRQFDSSCRIKGRIRKEHFNRFSEEAKLARVRVMIEQ